MSRNKAFIIAGLMLVTAVVAGWLIAKQFVSVDQTREAPLIELQNNGKQLAIPKVGPDNTVSVKVYFPDFVKLQTADGKTREAQQVAGLNVVERMVKSDFSPLRVTEAALDEFFKGLGKGFEGAKVAALFKDRHNVVYVDMTAEFLKGFNMDAADEYNLMRAFYRTATANSGAEDIKILVAGKEIESFGGHFFGFYPMKETFGM
ncbi:MAG: GerMN domain-containing protein [Nitrospiraceae bacterium]|nr:GerMN domain-containing protein [Nitrospiraceae bacterium]